MSVRVDRPIEPGQMLFDENQATKMLGGISYHTLRLLPIEPVRIKSRKMYRRADLEAFVEQLRVAS